MTKETQWTPGPWQKSGILSRSPEYKGHSVGPDGKDPVVVVPYTDSFHSECIANARLIAAAPDMYGALEKNSEAFSELAEWLLSGDGRDMPERFRKPLFADLQHLGIEARKTLAKARGES